MMNRYIIFLFLSVSFSNCQKEILTEPTTLPPIRVLINGELIVFEGASARKTRLCLHLQYFGRFTSRSSTKHRIADKRQQHSICSKSARNLSFGQAILDHWTVASRISFAQLPESCCPRMGRTNPQPAHL